MTIPELMFVHHGPECVIAPTPFLAKVLGVSTEAGILALFILDFGFWILESRIGRSKI